MILPIHPMNNLIEFIMTLLSFLFVIVSIRIFIFKLLLNVINLNRIYHYLIHIIATIIFFYLNWVNLYLVKSMFFPPDLTDIIYHTKPLYLHKFKLKISMILIWISIPLLLILKNLLLLKLNQFYFFNHLNEFIIWYFLIISLKWYYSMWILVSIIN